MTKKSKAKKLRYNNRMGYLFISPWIFCFLLFTLYPLGMSLYYSFTNFNFLSAPSWIGLDNYAHILANDKWMKAVKVTMIYVFVSVPLRLIFAFFIAHLLSKDRKGVGLYRTLYYLPSLIGSSVAVGVVWRTFFERNGVVDLFLQKLGIHTEYSLLGNPKTALGVLILLAVWQYGTPMLTFLAGIKNLPPSLYEAAKVDGASKTAQFWKITIPLMTPIIMFNLVMQMIQNFMVFTQGYVITGGKPLNSTLFYVVYVYQTTFEDFKAGRGSAMAWVMLLFVALMTIVLFSTSKYWVLDENKEGEGK